MRVCGTAIEAWLCEPIAWGDPAQLGIDDLTQPDYGDAPVMEPGDVPVFWGCGVTPQSVIVASKFRSGLFLAHNAVQDRSDDNGRNDQNYNAY